MSAIDSHPPKNEQLLATLQQLVEPLAATLVGPSEVIVHDLSRLPNSIIAISGDVTGRTVGDPATDKLLHAAVAGRLETSIGYRTTSPTGKRLLSTTIILRDAEGAPAAALCINRDISEWEQLQALATALAGAPAPALQEEADEEVFVRDVDELGALLLAQAVAAAPVPV